MKKLLVALLVAGMVFGFSCKKGGKEETKTPEPTQPATPPQSTAPQASTLAGNTQPAGKVIPPEKFFKFEVDRLELLKKHKTKFLDLLKSSKTKNTALIDKIKDANKAIVADFMDLTKKGDINPFDYRKTNEDAEAQKANSDYIAKHTDITEKIRQLQSEIVNIDTATKAEVERLKITQEDLMGKPAAPAPAPAQGGTAPKTGAPATK